MGIKNKKESKELVVVQNNEPLTNSLIIAEGMGLEHRAIMYLINKYIDIFKETGQGTFNRSTVESTGGRPMEIAWLNEDNAIFLITLMRNSDIVVEFKRRLAVAFVKQRKFISTLYANKQNAEWIELRNNGKVSRKEETDIIKSFVEYATRQGSKNAERYYTNITNAENQALFFISEKYPNLRELMDVRQLFAIGAADQIVTKALRDGMAEEMPYKDIFLKAKEAVEKFAEVIGKSPLPKETVRIGNQRIIELFK